MDLWCLKIIGSERAETYHLCTLQFSTLETPPTTASAVNVVILSALFMALAQKDGRRWKVVSEVGRFCESSVLPYLRFSPPYRRGPFEAVFSTIVFPPALRFWPLPNFRLCACFVAAQAFNEMLIAPLFGGTAHPRTFHVPLALVFYLTLDSPLGAIGAVIALAN